MIVSPKLASKIEEIEGFQRALYFQALLGAFFPIIADKKSRLVRTILFVSARNLKTLSASKIPFLTKKVQVWEDDFSKWSTHYCKMVIHKNSVRCEVLKSLRK